MTNRLRVISVNEAEDATLTASSTAGSLVVGNLLTLVKTDVWRSTSTTATITCVWGSPVIIGCTSFPFCNFSPTATMRVLGYTEPGDSVPIFDSGTVLASPPTPLGLWGWGADPLGVNAFTFGGGTYGTAWNTPTSVKKTVTQIIDTANTAGYVEAGCMLTGMYWEPLKNADYGATITPTDSSKHVRTASGNLKTDIGFRSRLLSISLSKMNEADRNSFWSVVRGNGKVRPVFVSLYPENDDTTLTQMNEIYCKISDMDVISTPSFNIYSGPLKIEEI